MPAGVNSAEWATVCGDGQRGAGVLLPELRKGGALAGKEGGEGGEVMKPQLGKGHGGSSKLPAIQKIGGDMQRKLMLPANTEIYRLGECVIFVTPPTGATGWILSINHKTRYPTWDEVAKARYDLLPHGITMAMILPPPDEYINIASHCFLLNELKSEEIKK